MELRPARHEDADAVIAALEWLFAPPGARPALYDPARARAALAHAIGADDAEVLLATDADGTVSGVCTVALDLRSIRFGLRAWVEDLAVDPARRSTGVGRALLDAARAWGRERGATHLELDSGDSRTDAHRFYERQRPDWTSRSFGWVL
ncbi:MAG: GCN5-related N-acetyltransferase [Solirubrobacterales bacterium]|jgi:GNAT superfamily N-acetyltransferase|nr:GCN5-related N-acetyltransferase [Solirubrobacterales bacterium]